jgi:CRISPR-associated endonuclease/helicase Cas3
VSSDDDDDFELTRLLPIHGGRGHLHEAVDRSLLQRLPDDCVQGPGIVAWSDATFMQPLRDLADARAMSLRDCSRRFATVTLPEHEAGYRFHPTLGFAKRLR